MLRMRSYFVVSFMALGLVAGGNSAWAQKKVKGQRVFYSGHSFHYFVPPIVADMAKNAKIDGHQQLGLSAIGGSRVYQHWNALAMTYYPGPDTTGKPLPGAPTVEGTYTVVAKSQVKESLKAGKIDVFTMSPIYLPDDGIEKFVKLGVESNPKIRMFVQENWLPWDRFDPKFQPAKERVNHDAQTADSVRKMHAPYFKMFDDHVAELNKKFETNAVRVAPVGQAVVRLREKILAGEAPGLKKQSDLFTDAIGHASAPVMALEGYVYLALFYELNPIDLPVPAVLAGAPEAAKLNRLLQEIAWQAVTEHPLSGVKAAK
jgi:hypothetical protein